MNDASSRYRLLQPEYLKILIPLALFLLGALVWPDIVVGVTAPFLVGLVLAYIFNPVVGRLDDRLDNRLLSTALVYLLLLVIVVGATWAVGGIAVHELRLLGGRLGAYVSAIWQDDDVRVLLNDQPLVAGWPRETADGVQLLTIIPPGAESGRLQVKTRDTQSNAWRLAVQPDTQVTHKGPVPDATTSYQLTGITHWPEPARLVQAATGSIIALQLANTNGLLDKSQGGLVSYVPPEFVRDLVVTAAPTNLRRLFFTHILPALGGINYASAAQGVGNFAGGALQATTAMIGGLTSGALFVVNSVTFLVLVLVITFYLLVDYENLLFFLRSLLPRHNRDNYLRLAGEMDKQLSAFLRGQLMVCICIGVLTATGLWGLSWFIPIRYPILIGAFAGLFNLVPYLGPFMGLLPALLLTTAEISAGADANLLLSIISILVLFGLIQTLDGFLISPNIMSGAVELHPMVILLALLAGGKILGILGMLLAVPVTCILRVVLREIYLPSSRSSGNRRSQKRKPRGRSRRDGQRHHIKQES